MISAAMNELSTKDKLILLV